MGGFYFILLLFSFVHLYVCLCLCHYFLLNDDILCVKTGIVLCAIYIVYYMDMCESQEVCACVLFL